MRELRSKRALGRASLTWILACCLLAACGDNLTTRPATQITVRIYGSLSVQASARALRIQVAPRLAGKYTPREAITVPLEGLSWPVDIPVVPGDGQSARSRFEVIVQGLDGDELVLAEARAITNFVAGDQRILPVRLQACGDTPVCQLTPCHGEDCQTCLSGSCADTPVLPGEGLERLDPDVAPDEDPATGADAGSEQCEGSEARCVGRRREVCSQGEFRLDEVCEAACFEGACTGECRLDEKRCGGEGERTPETCDERGTWQASGESCANLCSAGACAGDCRPGTRRCLGDVRQECADDGTWGELEQCIDLCRAGECIALPSCSEELRCGESSQSCCTSREIPGGDFARSFDRVDYTEADYQASVADFRLDRYEVTVGRFRRWVNAYDTQGTPTAGDGANPNNPDDMGWSAAWNDFLVADVVDLRIALASCVDATWTDETGDSEDMPVNCVTWYEAQAFCLWDRARLPTEAEWNYAAAGGDQQRVFPWSVPATNTEVSEEQAVYYPSLLSRVGSRAVGDARWGQADLAGNVQEWVQDWFLDPYSSTSCNNCAELGEGDGRVIRGGAYAYLEDGLMASFRSGYPEDVRSGRIGFRCAR